MCDKTASADIATANVQRCKQCGELFPENLADSISRAVTATSSAMTALHMATGLLSPDDWPTVHGLALQVLADTCHHELTELRRRCAALGIPAYTIPVMRLAQDL